MFKNIKYITRAGLLLLLIGSSCKSFIEVDLPKGQLTNQVVFQDASTAEAAILNVLGRLRGSLTTGVFGFTYYAGQYTDELEPYQSFLQGEGSEFYYNNVMIGNGRILSMWRDAYALIYATNSILEGLDKAKDEDISAENKKKLIGETLFLRSYINLYTTGIFGDIPYITTTDYQINKTVSRTAKAKVMKHLVEDVKLAIEWLPNTYSTSERLRPNAWVARALLARIYLYMGEWEKAEDLSDELIKNSLFRLMEEEDLSKVFHINSPETIWQFSPAVRNGRTVEASSFYFTYAPPSSVGLTAYLVNAFSADDKRPDYWILSVDDDAGNTYYYSQKYKNRIDGSNGTERSIQFRLAEQYLIRSESRIRLENISDGRDDLNRIRQRAGLMPLTSSDPDLLLDELLKERFRELFLEYPHRLFDVVRTGRTDIFKAIKQNWDDNDILWPIPEKEIELNPHLLPQNTGY